MRPAFHFRPDLQPVSRLTEAELRQHWLALVNFVLEGRDAASIIERLKLLGLAEDDEVLEAIKGWATSASDRTKDGSSPEVLSPGDIEQLYTKSTHAEAIPIPDPAGLEEHSHKFIRTDFENLDNSRFDMLWAKGEPMVIDNVDKRLKLSWTPDDFIERFGEEPCGECRSSLSEMTVTYTNQTDLRSGGGLSDEQTPFELDPQLLPELQRSGYKRQGHPQAQGEIRGRGSPGNVSI